jgi:hypothetical protein
LTHRNSKIHFFEKRFDSLGKTLSSDSLGKGAYFDLQANKGEVINIMNKVTIHKKAYIDYSWLIKANI